jgi:HAD superfamily hydrolase (TIGR01484 family)
MQYLALASDYDGTIAHHGHVSDETLAALEKLRQSGRKLILVTGRELPDLQSVFPRMDLFDRVVAENGGVLYDPGAREKRVLAEPPKPQFVETLRARGVDPVSVGDVIVATWSPNEKIALDTIRDLGLELQVVFNKGAVMILPAGINKKSGLKSALDDLGLSAHNVIGVGDAENDHAFLSFCGFSAAVSNALPAVKETADLTTGADHGAGVNELIEMVLSGQLTSRHGIVIGKERGQEVSISSYGNSLLVAGASGSGKSTFIAGLLQTLIESEYQVCLIDPEGDYGSFPGTTTVGDDKHAPAIEQVLQNLEKPAAQVIVNLVGVAMADRPDFFVRLLPRLQELRLRTGRPHWIVVDEAHHLLPAQWAPGSAELAGEQNNIILITVHPDRMPHAALKAIDVVVCIGPSAENVTHSFPDAPRLAPVDLPSGEALVWFRRSGAIRQIEYIASTAERKRHQRKYAHGELAEDRSFYFRGPDLKLNLRAQNLITFVQLAEGVDDGTWMYHLRCGDYSRWFREDIKDPELAADALRVEQEKSLNPRQSREKIREAIEQRYTAPA